MSKIIVKYVDEENNIVRVGIYSNIDNNLKWIKWLSKDNFELFARVNNIIIYTEKI